MSKIYDDEIKKMQRLISFGNSESNAKSGAPIVEYHAQAADGKTYGILRECDKFYIKVAPKKDTEILAEDYDYIGGFMNKKENEYTTYAVASKQFDMKLKAINEACGSKKVIEQFSTVKPAEWQINETKEMRDEINRFNQIVKNSLLIEEGKSSEDTYVGTTGDKGEKPDNGPKKDTYTEKPTEKRGKIGAPFVEVPVADKKDGYDLANNVAESKARRSVKLTEEQVLAWNRKNPDFIDRKEGDTHVGSSAPYGEEVGCESNQCEADTDPIKEEKAVHNTDNQNYPNPGTGEVGDGDPYDNTVNEGEEIPSDVVAGLDDEGFDDEGYDDIELEPEKVESEDDPLTFSQDETVDMEDEDVPFPEVAPSHSKLDVSDEELDNWDVIDDDNDVFFGNDDPYNVFDSYSSRGGEPIYEVVLNDFGKHPAWRKEPFTYPDHNMPDKFGKDWNDDSTKGNEPYAKQIGSGDPYTEKVIDMITDSVLEALQPKKKV